MVAQLIEASGGLARVTESPPSPDSHRLADGGVALVAAGEPGVFSPESSSLRTISACKAAGVQVVAYEDGAGTWPLRLKCLPLLAGAVQLLDSGGAGFANELGGLLRNYLEQWAGHHRENLEIEDLMRRLGMAGQSAAFTSVFRLAMRYSEVSDLPVLITGESGTGKELMARAIARMDAKRRAGPFVAVNCAAISPALIESEFFGHRRGAFTGADRERKGLIRAADGGVLFLDEIGELDLGLQAKLLRVLQENRVLTVGDEHEMAVNVRFIAATNQDLQQLSAERKFRDDLYHRLCVLGLHLPPLRERPDDIPALVRHFLQKRPAIHAGQAIEASADYLQAVRQLNLPGNARQLENLVYHSLAQHKTVGPLDLSDLPSEALRQVAGRIHPSCPASAALPLPNLPIAVPGQISSGNGPTPPEASLPNPGRLSTNVPEIPATTEAKGLAANSTAEVEAFPGPAPTVLQRGLSPAEMNEFVKRILDGQGWNLSRALDECERHVFVAALRRTGGNQSQTARLLGITARSVYNKVHKFQIGL